MRSVLALSLILVAGGVVWAGLDGIRAEPNLERRSALAMDNAVAALKEAREAYGAGDLKKTAAKIEEVQESVELMFLSLTQTNKDPRRSPKWFKRAEIQSRDLLRSMDTLQHDMNFEDRALLDKTKEKVQEIHDDLLTGLMEGKRK